MATVGIVGCGEAFDTGSGNNACLLFGAGVPTVLFDCGYQIPERLWALPGGAADLDAVYLTHFHADHAFGLGPLIVRMHEERRSRPLEILGPAGVDAYVRKVLDLAYPGVRQKLKFRVPTRGLREGDRIKWRGLKLECAATVHSVRNLSVRVETAAGSSLFVSGDGRFTEASMSLAFRSDLVLHEAYFARQDHPTHTNLVDLQEALSDSKARKIVITHPSRTDKEAVGTTLRRIAREDPRWEQAAPGKTYSIRVK
ncbi:MAG TPA: ribonuclease Z [Bdellovibrionota bacterium]|jgi:ribonuclease BN (tRNA processing enzyme)|nr:ribonuclease Z [Bdellovibrionota bacterium]